MRVQHLTEWRTNRKFSLDSGPEMLQENQLFPEGAAILQQALWIPSIAPLDIQNTQGHLNKDIY